MERALKSNFLTKSTPQQLLFEDLFYVNGVTGAGVSCDDFSVDTFLDLPNDDDFGEDCLVGEEQLAKENSSSSNFSGDFDSGSSFPAGDLSVPVEDIDQLEWLSQFVDDSPSELSLLCPPTGKGKTVSPSKTITFVPVNRPPPPPPAPAQISPVLQSPPSVPTKPRSKRSRPNGQAWSKALQLIQEWAASSNVKRQRKCMAGDGGGTQLLPRQCSHCHVQKTPQWRSGPLGEKTLCNACGVRYKSGRLFPEYRPASSPTFLENVHSNSHRKVLEMRMKKELTGPGSGVGVMNSMMVPNLEMQFNRVTSF